ncbi:MAG: FecR domain-containing protein [Myxococcales bacterium]|nr:FecR domain-containing protein [Myxococcales bacterium]
MREAQADSLHLDNEHERARARARLLQAVDLEQTRGRAPSRAPARSGGWRWATGTVLAAACAFAVFVSWPGDRVLEFEVDGEQVAANELNQLIIGDEDGTVLDFSDDTRVELGPDSKARVGDLRSNGAVVTLEEGSVSLAVHHEDDTSWRVEAGPWEVHVTGTQFTVDWEPSSGEFAVAVSEGSVRIEGPEGAVANVGAGDQPFRARGKATIEPETLDIDDEPKVAQRPSDEESREQDGKQDSDQDAGQQDAGQTQSSTQASKSKAKTTDNDKPGWQELNAQGDFADAWEAVAQRPGGIIGEADRVDAKTMIELAYLARYNKSRSDARTVLERVRERFPDSEQSSEAAFLLGRMAADGGDHSKAVTWFERYLDENPNGALAGDALGRLMDSYGSLTQTAKVRDAAERYLAAYPKGTHADKARKILGQ